MADERDRGRIGSTAAPAGTGSARPRWRSVRVRLTLVATAATALMMTAAAYGLVRTVEHSLFDRVEDRSRDRLERVAALLKEGVPPDQLPLEDFGIYQTIQVFDDEGNLEAGAPMLVGVAGGGGLSAANGDPAVGGGVVAPAAVGAGPGGGPGNRIVVNDRGDLMTVASEAVRTPLGKFQVKITSPLDDVRRSVDTLQATLTFALPALVALVGLVAWLVTGRALRPVEAIRLQVESISASTIHRRVPEPDTGDEISRLARTMNAMLDRLERSSTRQRQFVSDASHELRSPVATIRAEMEVALRADERGTADWRRSATSVLTEEARLEALVSDLLLLAAVDEADAGFPPDAVVDLGDVVQHETERQPDRSVSIEAVTPTAAMRNGPSIAGPGSARAGTGLTVRGDRLQLSRVVANVVDNAVRHARTTVRVSIARRAGDVRILVDDDGLGIAIDDRERVFERFTRLEEARSRDGGGAGLGLAMVRAIVARHHGRVWVEDAPLGGARFVIELPSAAG